METFPKKLVNERYKTIYRKISYDFQKKEATHDEGILSPISIIVPSNLALARNPLTRQYKSHCCHDMVLCHRAL